MSKTYKSDIMAVIHETATDLHDEGLMDKATMRQFDKSCLTKVTSFEPSEISALREDNNVSQSVFAHYLNVTAGLVSKWERGEKHPSGASLKLLSLVKEKGLDAIA